MIIELYITPTDSNGVDERSINYKYKSQMKQQVDGESISFSYLNVNMRNKIIKSKHFNIVLRLLNRCKDFNSVEKIFQIMTSTSHSCNDKSFSSSWKPNTFTIAEFVRSSRSFQSCKLAHDAITWGLRNDVYIPIGVISDCLSLIYRYVTSISS